jgi:hypothetical protein
MDIGNWRFFLSYPTVRNCVSSHDGVLLFQLGSTNRVVDAQA